MKMIPLLPPAVSVAAHYGVCETNVQHGFFSASALPLRVAA
jgi:hypothetical protein